MSEQEKEKYIIEPGQEWEIDLFREEDAEGVCNLFISVYGKDYPIKTYIDPVLLTEANRRGDVISSVARTEKGDIVGHNALFQSAPYKGIYESGAGLVHKNYRGGKGIFTGLFVHSLDVGVKSFNVELAYGEPVCNHVISQRLSYSHGLVTMAMEIDLMPAEAYSKEASSEGRVTTTLNFRTFIPKRHTVFIPQIYSKSIRFLYSEFDDQRDINISRGSPEPGSRTRVDIQVFEFARVSRLAIWDMGEDFEDVIQGIEEDLNKRGITVIQAWCNLGSPSTGWAVDVLKNRGYFFGGVLPRWFDTDGMLMQRLFHEPFWDSIMLYYERDREILSMIKDDWSNTRQ